MEKSIIETLKERMSELSHLEIRILKMERDIQNYQTVILSNKNSILEKVKRNDLIHNNVVWVLEYEELMKKSSEKVKLLQEEYDLKYEEFKKLVDPFQKKMLDDILTLKNEKTI